LRSRLGWARRSTIQSECTGFTQRAGAIEAAGKFGTKPARFARAATGKYEHRDSIAEHSRSEPAGARSFCASTGIVRHRSKEEFASGEEGSCQARDDRDEEYVGRRGRSGQDHQVRAAGRNKLAACYRRRS
jgi:hypothetical protein